MPAEPDPDWYFDHVLMRAEPGIASTIRVDEVVEWQAWWTAQAREVRAHWPELAGAALREGFVLTAAQLRAAGTSRASGRGLVRRGEWSAPVRGSVALVGSAAIIADAPDRWAAARRTHALECAAAAVINTGHAVTGDSAAVLRGLPVFALPQGPQLTVPPAHTVRRSGARVAGLSPGDVTDWFGIPVTTAVRTVVDVARDDRRAGLIVADAAMRTRLVNRRDLDAALERASGWPGVRQARGTVALADPLAESPLESILRLAAHDAGFPAPQLQCTIAAPGRGVPYRVDMLWPDHGLIVEADGRGKYSDDKLWAEKKRDLALQRLGYRVEHVIWSDVVNTWPATRALLAEALGC